VNAQQSHILHIPALKLPPPRPPRHWKIQNPKSKIQNPKSKIQNPKSKIQNSSPSPVRFIDLFCGIDGFRIAFEKAGGKCVFSSDYE
jgi:DNA (cytosine-5)-methyltransferase 1